MRKLLNWLGIICIHDYQKVNEFTIKSGLTKILESGQNQFSGSIGSVDKVVTDYKCGRCGRLKRFES